MTTTMPKTQTDDGGPPEKRRRTAAQPPKAPKTPRNARGTAAGGVKPEPPLDAAAPSGAPKAKKPAEKRKKPTAPGGLSPSAKPDEKKPKRSGGAATPPAASPPPTEAADQPPLPPKEPRCTDIFSEKWAPEFKSTYPLSKALERRKVLVEYIQLVKRCRARVDKVESPPKRNVVTQPQTMEELEREVEKCDLELEQVEKKREENANLRKDLTNRYKALYRQVPLLPSSIGVFREEDEELKRAQEAASVTKRSEFDNMIMSLMQQSGVTAGDPALTAAVLPTVPPATTAAGDAQAGGTPAASTFGLPPQQPLPAASAASTPGGSFAGMPPAVLAAANAGGLDLKKYLQSLAQQNPAAFAASSTAGDAPGPSGLQSTAQLPAGSSASALDALKQTGQHLHSGLNPAQLAASSSAAPAAQQNVDPRMAALAAAAQQQAMQKSLGIGSSTAQRPSPSANLMQQAASSSSASGLLSQGTSALGALGTPHNPFASASQSGLLTQQSQGGLISQGPQAQPGAQQQPAASAAHQASRAGLSHVPTSALNAAAAQNVFREMNQASPNPQVAASQGHNAFLQQMNATFASVAAQHQQQMQQQQKAAAAAQQQQQQAARPPPSSSAMPANNQQANAQQQLQELLSQWNVAAGVPGGLAALNGGQVPTAQQLATLTGLQSQLIQAAANANERQQREQAAQQQQAAQLASYQQMLANPHLARLQHSLLGQQQPTAAQQQAAAAQQQQQQQQQQLHHQKQLQQLQQAAAAHQQTSMAAAFQQQLHQAQMQQQQQQANLLGANFLQPTRQSPMQNASPTPARKPSAHSGSGTPQTPGQQQRLHANPQLHHSPHLQQQNAGRSATPQFAVPNLPPQPKGGPPRAQSTRPPSNFSVSSVITSTQNAPPQHSAVPTILPPAESLQQQQQAEAFLAQLAAGNPAAVSSLDAQALAQNPLLLMALAQQQQQQQQFQQYAQMAAVHQQQQQELARQQHQNK
ncbi:hypothetical protein M3Y99_00659700 [Aphelenchoides fujianensis]|nr:hypothetical protein M3Y99_00659700 [Aphelenchoides fujianensis]